MSFPTTLGFNVTQTDPFRNNRYYARRLKNELGSLQTFEIRNATGEFLGKIHVSHHKTFPDLLDSLKGAASSLAVLKELGDPDE